MIEPQYRPFRGSVPWPHQTMTNPQPTTRSVRERFFQLLPRRRELSIKLFGSLSGLSASRLFVLLALCEAEIPSKASIRAMARALPVDFSVPRVRSMRHRQRLAQVLMRLKRRGVVQQMERDGIACFEVLDSVRRALGYPDGSAPASYAERESNRSADDESPIEDPGTGNGRGNGNGNGNGDSGCEGGHEPESHGKGGANETT